MKRFMAILAGLFLALGVGFSGTASAAPSTSDDPGILTVARVAHTDGVAAPVAQAVGALCIATNIANVTFAANNGPDAVFYYNVNTCTGAPIATIAAFDSATFAATPANFVISP